VNEGGEVTGASTSHSTQPPSEKVKEFISEGHSFPSRNKLFLDVGPHRSLLSPGPLVTTNLLSFIMPSVLRECGQVPLQFYWFRAAVRFYNALLRSNSDTLVKVLKADIALSAVEKNCWSAEFLDAFHGLERRLDFHCRLFHCLNLLWMSE